MRRYLKTAAICTLLGAAMLAWFAFGFIAYRMDSRIEALVKERQSAAAEEAKASSVWSARALLRATATERAKLEETVSTDLISIATTIESVGPLAQANLKIESATAVPPKSKSEHLREVVLVVRAEGSFEQIVRILSLLESLPIALTVDGFDFEKPGETGDSWLATFRLRTFTTAPLPV